MISLNSESIQILYSLGTALLSSHLADCINKYAKAGADSKTMFDDIFVLVQGKWAVFKNKTTRVHTITRVQECLQLILSNSPTSSSVRGGASCAVAAAAAAASKRCKRRGGDGNCGGGFKRQWRCGRHRQGVCDEGASSGCGGQGACASAKAPAATVPSPQGPQQAALNGPEPEAVAAAAAAANAQTLTTLLDAAAAAAALAAAAAATAACSSSTPAALAVAGAAAADAQALTTLLAAAATAAACSSSTPATLACSGGRRSLWCR